MLQPGKMKEIGLEMVKFGISAVALQDIRGRDKDKEIRRALPYF
jgi:hypothetical protein